ncbi:MAG: helix-turn-helix transcriptional regulator [archaeon]
MIKIKWNKEKVINKIKNRYNSGKPINYQAVVNDNEKLSGAARRYFGSWDNALIASGFDPKDIKYSRKNVAPPGTWTKQHIIATIRKDWEEGYDLSAHASQKRSGSLVAQGQQLFGSWGKALEAAGISVKENKKVILWDKKRIIKRIKYIYENDGYLNRLNAEAWNPALVAAAVDNFGSWDKAIKAANINPEETRKTEKWSKSKTMLAIAKGKRTPMVHQLAKKYFGSWEKALKEVGFPVNKDNNKTILSNNIRKYRKKAGLSEEELGEKIGYSHRTISMLELNQYKNPRISLVLKIAKVLNCKVDDLYEL